MDKEKKKLLEFVRNISNDCSVKILEIGCGFGNNILLIKENIPFNIEIDGIDINIDIVESNKRKGLSCYTPEDFKKVNKNYDCLIFSHIIEHFPPAELKSFLDFYFNYLKDGGYVIIATPLLWKGFYWDFDHIKMYHPVGINMVFSGSESQVQYYSKSKLHLLNIYFRRNPYIIHNKRSLYIKNHWTILWNMCNLMYKILFHCSFGYFGETTGWIGVYRKNLIEYVLKSIDFSLFKDKKFAIWGTGITAEQLLNELKNTHGFGKEMIRGFFCGEKNYRENYKFAGYDILNYHRINDYNITMIIIAAWDYEEEIYQQIKKLYRKKIKIVRFNDKYV